LPAGQGWQSETADAPTLGENVPTGQGLGLELPGGQ